MNFDSSYKQETTRDRRALRWSIAALVTIAALGIAAFIAMRRMPAPDEYRYAGLVGPTTATVVRAVPDTPWQRYHSASPSRIAILLTDPNSDWLGLVHGFKAIGLPFSVTRDAGEAATHDLVLIYPAVSGKLLPSKQIATLEAFVRKGGTLVAFDVVEPDLAPFFGFSQAVPSRARSSITLTTSSPLTRDFVDAKERHLRFADRLDPLLNAGSYGYTGVEQGAVARFDDGTAAIVEHAIGAGKTYAIGVDVGALLLKGYNNREQNIAAAYDNAYQPTLDVFLRLLRDIYQRATPEAVTLGTVPNGKRFSVIIAHDVDSSVAIGHCLEYAAAERALGITTTYFLQSKYVRDYNDTAFFDEAAGAMAARLSAMGMEVASHSVSHSRQFSTFPVGTGTESYPSYAPFILDKSHTRNGTILGELRVSKFILEHFAHTPVVSFRPGNLSNPFTLPENAERVGYRYISATTADDSLTHLPFQLNAGRDTKAEVRVFEIPVTVEDEAPPRMDKRESDAERLAENIARYGGVVSILIHPNVAGYKLDFEKRFVQRFKREAYFETYRDFGDWWSARNDVTVDTRRAGDRIDITITAPEPIAGLPIALPSGRVIVLGAISGTTHLRVSAKPSSLPR